MVGISITNRKSFCLTVQLENRTAMLQAVLIFVLVLGYFLGFWFVTRDTVGNGGRCDIERGSDSSGAGHVGDSRFTGEKTGDSEILIADAEVSFGTFAVKFGLLDAEIGIGRSAISNSLGHATELSKVWVVGVVAVEYDSFGVHTEKSGFGIQISLYIRCIEAGWDKVGQSGHVDG